MEMHPKEFFHEMIPVRQFIQGLSWKSKQQSAKSGQSLAENAMEEYIIFSEDELRAIEASAPAG